MDMQRIPNLGDYIVFPSPTQAKRSGFVVEVTDDMVFVSSVAHRVTQDGRRDYVIRRTGLARTAARFAPQLGYFVAPNPAAVSFGWRVEKPDA